jgi:hypothetical protein
MPEPETLADLLAEANRRVAVLTKSLPTVVDPLAVSLKTRVPSKVLLYREALIWRTEELARTACVHYTQAHLAAALTLTRAAVEGAAATWYLKDLVEKTVGTRDLAKLDDTIMRLMFGSRNEITDIEAINVITFVDRAEKDVPGFKKNYETLCEFAHPNWSGTSLLFSRIDHERVLVEFGNNMHRRDSPSHSGLHSLLGTLALFEHSYNKIGDLLPDLIKICETI